MYVCTKQNQQGKFEDITEPVSNLPIVVQRFIELYAQNAGSDRNVKIYRKTFVGISVREKQLCILNQ